MPRSGSTTALILRGTLGVADNTCPDRVYFSFSNGQTGWARKKELPGLWK